MSGPQPVYLVDDDTSFISRAFTFVGTLFTLGFSLFVAGIGWLLTLLVLGWNTWGQVAGIGVGLVIGFPFVWMWVHEVQRSVGIDPLTPLKFVAKAILYIVALPVIVVLAIKGWNNDDDVKAWRKKRKAARG